MQSVSNPLQALTDVFYQPAAVFQSLAEKNNWSWLPFFIVVGFGCLPAYLYFGFIDITWYQDMALASQADELAPAQLDQMREGMSRGILETSALVTGLLFPVIFTAVFAIYLHLMTKNDESQVYGFTDWYGFLWWTALPSVLNSLVALILIVTATNHQLEITTLNPLSLANAFSVSMTADWFGFLSYFRVDVVWGILLTGIGINQWTSFSKAKSFTLATAPHIVILTIWLLFLVM